MTEYFVKFIEAYKEKGIDIRMLATKYRWDLPKIKIEKNTKKGCYENEHTETSREI